ncbi:MAG: DMT family transporter [Moorellales bacterium]
MDSRIGFLLLAGLAGAAMAFQGSLNTVLGRVTGLMPATLAVHAVGAATAALLLLFPLGEASLAKLLQAPWYAYLGGVLGVLIIYSVVASIPRLGVAVATTAIIVGQVGLAMLIDHYGLFGLQKAPFTWLKLGGLALLAIGARLMLN